MFWNDKKESLKWNVQGIIIPPPRPKEIQKIEKMLRQAEYWINLGETKLARKHWELIKNECSKNT